VFTAPSLVSKRAVRAGLVLFAVAITVLGPSAAWAQGPDADLTITQIAAPNTVRVGDLLTYRLKVTNNGPSASMSVRFGDQIPPTSVFVSASAGCAQGFSPTYVTCQIGNLASGASTWRSITVRPWQAGPISNWARVMSPVTHDPVPANDVSTLPTTVIP
jgi:uncharacterized repeat protein (TIGR01451 family)